MLCRKKTLSVALFVVLIAGPFLRPAEITVERIEADWLAQEQVRHSEAAPAGGDVTPEQDAIGACDGVKDGKWGFHTENQNNPWWQIDLGESMPLERIVIYNRCDFADRASRLAVLISDDAETFGQFYKHDGTAFFGHTDGKPLVVRFEGAKARHIRLQQPGRNYFHLDEVEIYVRGIEGNIAPGKPATQSSTSQWSKLHSRRTGYDTARIVTRGLKLAENLAHPGLSVDEQVRTLNALNKRSEQLHGRASEEFRRNIRSLLAE